MASFKDKTFCASPNCINECGRKMTKDEAFELEEINKKLREKYLEAWKNPESSHGHIMMEIGISYSYFCGEPELKTSTNGQNIKIEF